MEFNRKPTVVFVMGSFNFIYFDYISLTFTHGVTF